MREIPDKQIYTAFTGFHKVFSKPSIPRQMSSYARSKSRVYQGSDTSPPPAKESSFLHFSAPAAPRILFADRRLLSSIHANRSYFSASEKRKSAARFPSHEIPCAFSTALAGG